jgi:hypothetical protein
MYLDLLIALQIILSCQLLILFKLVEILDVNFMPHACELISQVLKFAGNHGNGDSAQEASQGGLTEVSYGDGDTLIGRSVVKKFSRKKFTGRIVAYDPHTRWYKVLSSPLHVANVIMSPLKI